MFSFHFYILYKIVDVACNSNDFTILCFAITQGVSGLEAALSDGEWTIFAPTDAAFNELGEEVLSAVLADEEVLESILLFQ